MLKVGVIGVGHLGKIHLRNLLESPLFEVVGYHDPKVNLNELRVFQPKIRRYNSVEEIIRDIDVLDIVTPTLSHYEIAQIAIENKKHFFIEKPITHTVEQAKEIVRLADKYNLKGQVGHVERFNPAYKAVNEQISNPVFIEANRFSEFSSRGTDVSVVLDLMIHDIDIVLSIVPSPVKEIRASGLSLISNTPDICSARLLFENGTVANLTASRISLEKIRKMRLFDSSSYISIDFLSKSAKVVRIKELDNSSDDLSLVLENADGQKKELILEHPSVDLTNAIREELDSFAHSIIKEKPCKPSLKDGLRALEVANKINDTI